MSPPMSPWQQLAALREVRAEISRINAAAGETIFNPAATELLAAVIAEIEADR